MKNNNGLNKKCGVRLKECREESHITQETLSIDTNYSIQTISYIENGKRGMSTEAARIFSKRLKVRMEYLLCEDNFKTYSDLIMASEAIKKKENLIVEVFTENGYLPMGVEGNVIYEYTDYENQESGNIVSIDRYIILTPDNKYVVCSECKYNDMIDDIIAYIKLKIERLTQSSNLASESDINRFNEYFETDPDDT